MTVTDLDIERLHREAMQFERHYTYMRMPTPCARAEYSAFGARVVADVRARIEGLGYFCARTGAIAHYDLMVEGCRIEVKGAEWSEQGYRFNMRGNDADVLVIGCHNTVMHYFVIPFAEVAVACYVKITSHDPCDYRGKFMRWYEAWDVIGEMVRNGVNPWQMPLLDQVKQ